MKFSTGLLLAVVGLASGVPHYTMIGNYEFTDFVREFKKEYTVEEFAHRHKVFHENRDMIMAHNAKEMGWSMNVNKFADLTAEEHSAKFKGFDKKLQRQMLGEADTVVPHYDSVPDSVDWRTKGVITPVKDQGGCGSCWAFAATETMESYLALATGKQTLLSVQSVVSCTPNPNKCGGTGGCNGATAELGIGWVASNKGIPSEAAYPYTSGDGDSGSCQASQFSNVADFSGFVKLPENNFTAVMAHLGNTGPLAITVDAGQWQFYNSGILTPRSYSTVDLDHGVQAVGYGTENGKNYWIIRNSWGEGWGEKGFLRIARTDGTDKYCGTDSSPADGTGCAGGPSTVTACGSFGILYDTAYATGASPSKAFVADATA